MLRIAQGIDRLSRAVFHIAMAGAVIALLVMLAAAVWQVVARYMLSSPPAWTEEIARFSMVWAGLLGASCGFRLKADPSLFPEMREKIGAVGNTLFALRFAGVALLLSPVLWYSVIGLNGRIGSGYIARLMGRKTETMDISLAVFGIAIPIAFAFILIHLLAEFAARIAKTDFGDPG